MERVNIRISTVQLERRIEQKKFTFIYLNEEKIVTEKAIASVVHLVRYAQNGSLFTENTVLSCIKCDNTRGYGEENEKRSLNRCFFAAKN